MKKLAYIILILCCIIYLANPGAGIFEFIPDNIPFFGNLDEAAVMALLLALLKKWRDDSNHRSKPKEPKNVTPVEVQETEKF